MRAHRSILLPVLLPALLMLAAISGAATAASSRVYVNGVAPFAYYSEQGEVRGVLYDMLTDLNRRTGNDNPVTPVPLPRAQLMLATRPAVIATFARFSEIEHSYRWLCKLADDKLVLIARAGSSFDIAAPDAAKALRVGVLLGGPAEALARRLGFTRIDAVASSASNARKLAAGRIDVWITAWSIAAFEQRSIGGKIDGLRIGAVLQTMQQYLAAPRDIDEASAARWQAACAAMRKDGTHQRILRKYDFASALYE